LRNRHTVLLAASAVAALVAGTGCGADPGSPLAVGEAPVAPAAAAPDGTAGAAADDPTGGLPVNDAVDLRGQTEVTVQVKDNIYTLRDATQEETRVIRVDPGTKVTWVNDGANPHNVIPSSKPGFAEIPTGKLDPDMSASVRFDGPGLFPYHCSIHGTKTKGQRGLVVVGDS
jgi:plastocyanin